MLQNLGAGNAAFFVDVTDENDRNAFAFCFFDKRERAFLNLCNAAGGRGDLVVKNGLDRVYDENIGLYFVGLCQDMAYVGLGKNKQIVPPHAKTLGAKLELAVGFLTRNIKDLSVLTENVRDLHQKCGFSDAGLAGKKHHGAVYQAAAKHAVKLTKSRGRAHEAWQLQLFIRNGVARKRTYALYAGLGGGRCFDHILHKAVPFAARGAFSKPLWTFIFARTADIDRFKSLHSFALL